MDYTSNIEFNKIDFAVGNSYWLHNYNIYGGFEESDRCYFGKLEQIEKSEIDSIYDIAYITLNNGATITGLLSEFISKHNHIPDVGNMIEDK